MQRRRSPGRVRAAKLPGSAVRRFRPLLCSRRMRRDDPCGMGPGAARTHLTRTSRGLAYSALTRTKPRARRRRRASGEVMARRSGPRKEGSGTCGVARPRRGPNSEDGAARGRECAPVPAEGQAQRERTHHRAQRGPEEVEGADHHHQRCLHDGHAGSAEADARFAHYGARDVLPGGEERVHPRVRVIPRRELLCLCPRPHRVMCYPGARSPGGTVRARTIGARLNEWHLESASKAHLDLDPAMRPVHKCIPTRQGAS